MRRGRISIKEKIEMKLGFDSFWPLLKEHCSECKTSEEACQIFNDFINDPVLVIRPNVLENTIRKADDLGGTESAGASPFLKLIKKSHGKGKRSIRSIIEEKHGNFWDLIRFHCQRCPDETAACESLNSFTNDSGMIMKPQTLLNTISRSIEKKEITDDEFFVKWTIKKKRKHHMDISHDSDKTESPKDSGVAVHVSCQNCGHEDNWGFFKKDLLKYGVGVAARQCSCCKCWGTFDAQYNINGEDLQECIENWMEKNPSMKKSKQLV